MKYNTNSFLTVETYKRKKKHVKSVVEIYKSDSVSSKSAIQMTNKFRMGSFVRKREGKHDAFFQKKL